MDAILNNPFRILGLDPTLDEITISERASEILMLLTNGQKVSFPIDEFYDRILVNPYNTLYYNNLSDNKGEPILLRNIETVQIANEKLKDPIERKYYALFAFEIDKTFNGLDANGIIKTLESELKIHEKRVNKKHIHHYWRSEDLFLNFYGDEENDNYKIETSYNSLTIENLIDNGSFIKPNMNFGHQHESQFNCEFDCEWIKGIDNNSFSVFWGKHPLKNSYYSFGISGNGYFYLSNREDGKAIDNDPDFIGWKKSDVIHEQEQNHLEIRENIDNIEFYINNALVHKTNSLRKYYGNDLGFIVFGKQTVSISNFKENHYGAYLDYASDIFITNENFCKIKNLALLFFNNALIDTNIPICSTEKKEGKCDETLTNLSEIDKGFKLFSKYFQLDNLSKSGLFKEAQELTSNYNFIFQIFISDLLEGSNNWNGFDRLTTSLESLSTEFIENLFLFSKNQLLQLPFINDIEKYPIDIDLFRNSKIHKAQFVSTLNNPFRVLALNYDASPKQIAKRVSDLLIYAEMGKSPKYSADLFFGVVDRTPENIKYAAKILDNPDQKLYYSLLWFIQENKADKDFLNDLLRLNDIENCVEFKHFIICRAEGFTKKNNYSNSLNKISADIFDDTKSRLDHFIGSKHKYEDITFCLYDDITSALPVHGNCQKIDNQLIVNSNSENGVLLLKELYFDQEVDFEIEFDVEWFEGNDDKKLYSIVFCKDTGSNFYRFGISANGYFYFDAIVGGVEQNLCGWRKNEYIKIKAKNNLKVWYSSKHNDFGIEINGHYPKEISNFGIDVLKNNLLGNYLGISVFGDQKVAFSNFKIAYRHRISIEVSKSKIKSSNITSAINLVTSNLCLCSFVEKQFYYHTKGTISLFGEILNSNCMPEFASKVVGIHTNIDILAIERYFIDDIYNFARPQLDKDERIETKEFIEAFHSFSNASQNYIVHKFIGRPILEIENSIIKTKDFLKNTQLQGLILGFNLYNTTKEDLIAVRKILSYTNYQYRLLANNLADTLLDCGIIYFNAITKKRTLLLSEGNQILELINHANMIAVGGDARKRVDENIVFFEKWVSDALKKEQDKFRQEQEKRHQEKERQRKEQEKFKLEQEKQNQANLLKTQELKRLKNSTTAFRPTNVFADTPKTHQRSTKRTVKIVRNIFWPILFACVILYGLLTHKSIEPSKWKGNTLVNGASPYVSYFGEGIYDYNSKCWITFKNGNSTDAIACLVNYYTGTTVRNEYIRAGTDFTMSNLPTGVYKVKVFYGKDWNPEKTLNQGLIKGAFDTDFSFSISDNPKDLINVNTTETNEGIRYTTGVITLYTVSNGNMNQRKINSDEFFR